MRKKKDQTLLEAPPTVKEHIQALVKLMSEGIYEKQHIMAVALLSAIAGESVFLLGPPGTAKSMVARRLKMVFKDARAFEYLMSRFSTPDEIFGPVSISKLKNEDRYERLVDGYLPDAEIVFLDEIWKAGPSIQNALLTAINERIFKNGASTVQLPMKALIAASNELPAEDEGLEALWDRFLVRLVSNCISTESTFYKMVREKSTLDPVIPESLLITDEMYRSWQNAITDVEITDEVCHIATTIRKAMKEKQENDNVEPMDFYISDRRWKKAFHLMQTSAWLNGRKAVDITDAMLLIHCLWNKAEAIPTVLPMVCQAIVSEINDSIAHNKKALDTLIGQLSATMPKSRYQPEGEDKYDVTNYFYYTVEGYPGDTCLFAKADYAHLDSKKPSDGILYYEEKSKANIIHVIYTGAPFDYKMTNGKITRLKLQKCSIGVVVDGIPYAFRLKESSMPKGPKVKEGTFEDVSFSSTGIVLDECKTQRTRFESIKQLFADGDNMFVSADDKKLIMRELSKTEKQLNELEIKVKNTEMMMNR